jgi:uncharacterized repeat protein (TIGR01451 family)
MTLLTAQEIFASKNPRRQRVSHIALGRWSRTLGILLMASAIAAPQMMILPPPAWAIDICATPGKDLDSTLSGVINTYYPGGTTATAGATSISLGASRGAATGITAGDLLLIIQMQDATIDATNTDSYGDGVSGLPANGATALNTAGLYEYVVATNTVGAGGGTVTIRQPLVNTYTNADFTATSGQRRFQVIRIPQYVNATVSGTLTSVPWDGQTGGIVNLDVAQTLTFAGGTIDVSGQGFRGGGGLNLSGGGPFLPPPGSIDFVSPSSNTYHGSKGEGVAGTPRFVFDRTGAGVIDTGFEGYPNGSFARGAPGNAGGGGTDANQPGNSENSGGGGGANYGAGGTGGDSWPEGSGRQPVGGFGGQAFLPTVNRIVLGGGGGAASSNNSFDLNTPSGGSGSGIVMIRANQITGAGAILAAGTSGVSPSGTDGGPGAGAGGTVLLQAIAASTPTLTISASGGAGVNSGFFDHGPGGGGGGGYIAFQGIASVTPDVAGGLPGNDQAGGGVDPAADPYGATAGRDGLAVSATIPNAQVLPGALCILPRLRLVKRATAIAAFPLTGFNDAGTTSDDDNAAGWPTTPAGFLQGVFDNNQVPVANQPKPGDEIEYTLYFLSDGNADAANVTLCDFMPANTTYVPGTLGLTLGTTTTALSDSAADADAGQFIANGGAFPAACSSSNNNRGAVVVNLGTVTTSTAPGTPTTSYGYIRFRAKVD